ncbi:hypothetical protein HK097_006772, partial [Rhizophlyctis rosea]
GTVGVELHLGRGVKIEFGDQNEGGEEGRKEGKEGKEDVRIECGEFGVWMPNGSGKDGFLGEFGVGAEEDKGFGEFAPDLVAKLEGGVSIGLRTKFLGEAGRELKKDHTKVVLRSPEFCGSFGGKPWDAFRGFRSHSMHITLAITSPRSFFSGLTEPMNSLNLSTSTVDRFNRFFQVYQSALTNVPIRRGKVFQKALPQAQKPKLGRAIGTARIVTSMYPLVLGYITELETGGGGVGLRARAEKMDIDMTFVQRIFNFKGSGEEKEAQMKRKSVSKWNLTAAGTEVTDVELRTVVFGKGVELIGNID